MTAELARQVQTLRKTRRELLDLKGWILLEKLAAWCKGTPPSCTTSIGAIREVFGWNPNRIVALLKQLERRNVLTRKRRYQEETLFTIRLERLSESTPPDFHSEPERTRVKLRGRNFIQASEITSEITSEIKASPKESALKPRKPDAAAPAAPLGASGGRAAAPPDLESESSRPIAARARELTLTGSRPRTTAGREGHEHEATQDHEPRIGSPPRVRGRMRFQRMPEPPPPPTAEQVGAFIASLADGGTAEDERRARLHEYQSTGKWRRAWGPRPNGEDR